MMKAHIIFFILRYLLDLHQDLHDFLAWLHGCMAAPGLELDLARTRQLQASSHAGLEAIPADYFPGPAPQVPLGTEKQITPGPEKEAVSVSRDANNYEPPGFNNKARTRKSIWRKKRTWLLLALLVIAVIVVAIAVLLAVRHKGSNRYLDYSCRRIYSS